MATSYLSVISDSDYMVHYTDPNTLDIFHNIAAHTITAFSDIDTNQPVTMQLGATGDMKIETLSNIQLYTPLDGSIEYYHSTMSGSNRVDTKILDISAIEGGATVVTTDTTAIHVKGGDALQTTTVSDMTFQTANGSEWLSTTQSNVHFLDDVVFTSNVHVAGRSELADTYVSGNLVALHNFYGQNMNLIKTTLSNEDTEQIGYAFRINDSNQLELVKYSKFSSNVGGNSVIKRLAVFGNNALSSTDTSDVNNYLVFDEYNGVVVATEPTSASHVLQNKYLWRFGSTAGTIYSDQNVGIGTDAPTADLEVVGTVKTTTLDATYVFANGVQTTSDMRLKTIFNSVSSETSLEKVKKLDIVKYVFNERPDVEKTGFKAQQVREIINDAVDIRKHGAIEDCHFLDPMVIIAHLVGSVKELSAQVEDLKYQHSVVA